MVIDDLNKLRASLVQVIFEPGQENALRFELNLDEKEFAALGYALAHWAFLENALQIATISIAEQFGIPVPPDAHQDAFRKRLSAFREVIAQFPDPEEQKRLQNRADRISNENGFRQKIVHGMWSYKLADPDILHVEIPRAAGGPNLFLNVERIVDFAHKVSELSMQLLHPEGYTIEDIAEERAEIEGGVFSRSALRSMTGKAAKE